jgi:dCTP deaminase
MILTGRAIADAVSNGDIVISPFDENAIGVNSYDFRLGNRCRTYDGDVLDSSVVNPSSLTVIGDEGMVIVPSRLYLFNTYETMGSNKYVPIIRGRSSVGRLGLFIDITADLIDIGSINQWTLQLHAVSPIKIYPGMKIGQVTFWKPHGEIELYNGKYGSLESPVASMSYRDPEFGSG